MTTLAGRGAQRPTGTQWRDLVRVLLFLQPRRRRGVAAHLDRPRLCDRGICRRGGRGARQAPRCRGFRGPGASLRPWGRPHPRRHAPGGQRLHARLALRHPVQRGHGPGGLLLPAADRLACREGPARVARHHGRGALCAHRNRQGARERLPSPVCPAHGGHHGCGGRHVARRLPGGRAQDIPELKPLRPLRAGRGGRLLADRGRRGCRQAVGWLLLHSHLRGDASVVASLQRLVANRRGPGPERDPPHQKAHAPRARDKAEQAREGDGQGGARGASLAICKGP